MEEGKVVQGANPCAVEARDTVQARVEGSRKKLLAGEQVSKVDRPKAILVERQGKYAGKLRSGQAEPKQGAMEKMNVGKGRKEWRHFAEVDREREGDGDHTNGEVTMRNPNRGDGRV